MEFILSKEKSGYYPEVVNLLSTLSEDELHHEKYYLMHPADVFISIFEEVVDSAIKLIDSLESCVNHYHAYGSIEGKINDGLRVDILSFLFLISNFIDGCQSIIKSLFDDSKSQAAIKSNRDFVGGIKAYKDHIGKIINYIKHRHRRVRIISQTWDNKIVVGYFIEGVVAKNMIGPDPDIHKDSNCAISLNRDIPFHLVNLYFVSSCLENIILKNKIRLVDRKFNIETSNIFNLMIAASKIPRNYFLDEIKKTVPGVEISDSSNSVVKISNPSRLKIENSKFSSVKMSLATKIGIYNRSIKVPYMAKK